MAAPRPTIAFVVNRFLDRLRFPTLFKLSLVVLLLNVGIPDGLPFIDEIVLGLGTALLAAWKRDHPERDGERPPGAGPDADVIDV